MAAAAAAVIQPLGVKSHFALWKQTSGTLFYASNTLLLINMIKEFLFLFLFLFSVGSNSSGVP